MTPKCLCGEPISFCICPAATHGTTVKISRPVRCEPCWDMSVIKASVVYGKAKAAPRWAFFCAFHWASKGAGRLGSGSGQRLILEAPKDSTAPTLDGTLEAPRSKINYDSPEILVAEA